ncbi:MAG: Threonylcarbamoyl-AMP synthase [Myxococcota bacterium]|nr:Threonylcarbamoyl-AMP synthase [Myxococcota bacterium]
MSPASAFSTRVVAADEAGIEETAAILREDGIAAIPTETVYGLAGNAFSFDAAAKIFEAKDRPSFDPLIVHIPPPPRAVGKRLIKWLWDWGVIHPHGLPVTQWGRVSALMDVFWPGPLTIVLPRGDRIPEIVTAGLPSVGVRMPRHPAAASLLRRLDFPLAAPSANPFGRISPTSAGDVMAGLGGRIPLILDGGPCEAGVESAIVQPLLTGRIRLLRPGAATAEEIGRVLGEPLELAPRIPVQEAPAAPGMLENHYAPERPLWMLPHALPELSGMDRRAMKWAISQAQRSGAAVLAFRRHDGGVRESLEAGLGMPLQWFELSEDGDPVQCARELFKALRAMDGSGAGTLFCEPPPGQAGLMYAIGDRLGRASRPLPALC